MVSREQKKMAAVMYKKLQLLRAIANSHALQQAQLSKTSVASKYIQQLDNKQKIEKMNQNIATAAAPDQISTGHQQSPLPPRVIRVEAEEKSIFIKVFIESSCCRGLLVFILEAFEELGLDVLHARVSCSNGFLLEAIGVKKGDEKVDAQKVEEAVLQAIQSWSELISEK
ncbi:hypothetical protein ACOSQ3_021836 [Xanthoceras sorbifolium]